MNRIISTSLFFLFLSLQMKGQDIHFSQFYENAILRNPALTGIFSGDYKAGVNYRNQWSNISVPFQTALASAEIRVPINNNAGDFFSAGITATYDHAGSISFNSVQLYPAINYNKALEDEHHSFLSVGFAAGFIQRSADPNKMTFSTQYLNGYFNSQNPTGETYAFTKVQYFDLGTGISFNSSAGENDQVNYYLGVAVYHINKPKVAFNDKENFLRLNPKWNGNFGLQYAIDNELSFTTHWNYSKQGSYQEIIGGILMGWRKIGKDQQGLFTISGGVFYRFKDAWIPTVKLDYKAYAFTLSYDVNTSTLRDASRGVGGFELSVYTRGKLTEGIFAKNKNACPRFENMISPGFE